MKTLDYQDRPNYEYLKEVLGGVVKDGLDFSMPQGPAELSSIKVKEPATRKKVRTAYGQELSGRPSLH